MQFIPIISESVALLAAILFCGQKNIFKYFIPFLVYTLLNESVAFYMGYIMRTKNYFLYTIYVPISFCFYSFIISAKVINIKLVKFVRATTYFCFPFFLWNILFIQGFNSFNTYSNTLVSLVLILFSLIYLFDYLNYSQEKSNPITEPMFWIVAGLLFFYFGGMILNILYNYSVQQEFKINEKKMYSFVFAFLNILLYGCLSIAFYLCCKRTKYIY